MKRFVLTQAPPVVKQNYAGHVATLAHAYSDSLCYLCGWKASPSWHNPKIGKKRPIQGGWNHRSDLTTAEQT